MGLAITFLIPQNFQFFINKFNNLIIPIGVIYPDWDNLSRFGDILSLFKAAKIMYRTCKMTQFLNIEKKNK